MRQIMRFVFCVAILSTAAFAGPFGLSKGMTYSQVKKACNGKEPEKIEEGIYEIWPAKKHPDFERYFAWIDAKEGLHYIKAQGGGIKTGDTGIELKGAFFIKEEALAKKYGTCLRKDSLVGSFTTPELWMSELRSERRILWSRWSYEDGSSLPDDLTLVFLNTSVNWLNLGYLSLEYEFSNHEKVESSADDVL